MPGPIVLVLVVSQASLPAALGQPASETFRWHEDDCHGGGAGSV